MDCPPSLVSSTVLARLHALCVPPAQRRRPDLIFLDLRLPDFEGVTLLREVRSVSEDRVTPVAIITGDYFLTDNVRRELIRADHQIVKAARPHADDRRRTRRLKLQIRHDADAGDRVPAHPREGFLRSCPASRDGAVRRKLLPDTARCFTEGRSAHMRLVVVRVGERPSRLVPTVAIRIDTDAAGVLRTNGPARQSLRGAGQRSATQHRGQLQHRRPGPVGFVARHEQFCVKRISLNVIKNIRQRRRSVRGTLSTWELLVAYDTAQTVLEELWPDIRRRVSHH
jgi:CheY-like chemotaxis protein